MPTLLPFPPRYEKLTLNARVQTKIYREERQYISKNVSLAAAVRMPPLTQIDTALYAERNKRFLGFPKTISDVKIVGKWTKTLDNFSFLLADEGEVDKIIIFATDECFEIACKSESLFADGTFKIVPFQFRQLYIFHSEHLGQVFPLIFCLLPSKTTEVYIRMLNLIQKRAEERGLNFNMNRLTMDFESGAMQAVTQKYPNSILKGCMFHYGQCIWRKVQDLGLTTLYTDNVEVRKWVRRAVALAMVPVDRIDQGFHLQQEDAPDGIVDLNDIVLFHDYQITTWIDEEYALFPRSMWNHYNNEGARTINCAESFHSKINRLAGKRHVNIFALVELMQTVQRESEIEIAGLKSGNPPTPKRRKYRIIEDKIVRLKSSLCAGSITLLEYMDAISVIFHLEN